MQAQKVKKRENQDKRLAYLKGSKFYDEVTGERLDKKKVAEARREEMRYFEAVSMYRKVPYARVTERTGRRPIGTKRVDVKKADGPTLEFNNGIDHAMFAATL